MPFACRSAPQPTLASKAARRKKGPRTGREKARGRVACVISMRGAQKPDALALTGWLVRLMSKATSSSLSTMLKFAASSAEHCRLRDLTL